MTNRNCYEDAMAPARASFATNPALSAISEAGIDPRLLEAFLINFSARGVRITEPVERWLEKAAERCTAVGLPVIGQSLRGHAPAESGHHLVMTADTHTPISRRNARGGARPTCSVLIHRALRFLFVQSYCQAFE
jgi:hypothetical protein